MSTEWIAGSPALNIEIRSKQQAARDLAGVAILKIGPMIDRDEPEAGLIVAYDALARIMELLR